LGSINSVRTQLAGGRNINKTGFNESTALAVAALHGKTKLISFFLQQEDINVNKKDRYGNTPLHLAVAHDHPEIVRLLLRHKDIEINALNNEGKRAFNLAIQHEHTGIARQLLWPETKIRPYRKISHYQQNKTYSLRLYDSLRHAIQLLVTQCSDKTITRPDFI